MNDPTGVRMLFWLIVLSTTFGGCTLAEDEPVPSYIHISSISLEVKPDGTQGSDAHDITDAWVYADKKLIGVFQMPVTLPILKTGSTEITVFAGIRKNGRFSDRITYPFYTAYVTQVDLEPGSIDTLYPKVNYKDGAVFKWIEDFEDQGLSLAAYGNVGNIDSLVLNSDPLQVFEYDGVGNKYSGEAVLYKTGTFSHAGISSHIIPKASDVFLELHYKSDVNVQFGFYAEGSTTLQIPVLTAYPTDNWKKLYLGFTEDWNAVSASLNRLRVYVAAVHADSTAKPTLFIDNLKLIHF